MKQFQIAKLITISALGFLVAACSTSKLNDNPGAGYQKYSSDQLFRMGEKAIAKHSYSRAIKYYQALDALYPFSLHSEQAQKEIIYAYFKSHDYASAEAAADRYIRVYPQGTDTDYAYYMKGLSQLNQNRTFLQRIFPVDIAVRDLNTLQDAFYSFRDLVTVYPNSPYAADARERMVFLRDTFAQHELEIAIFYYKRGAYEAAINRADYVIKHYQGTPQIKSALELLVKANRKLGLTEAANRAQTVLAQNF